MTIKFQPYEVPRNIKFASSASIADECVSCPTTASLVEYTGSPVGPKGRDFRIITGSVVLI